MLDGKSSMMQIKEDELEKYLETMEEQVRECEMRKSKYKIDVPPQSVEDPSLTFKKSDVHILPISIHDEASTAGTAAILQQYIKEFDLPVKRKEEYLTLSDGKIDIKPARERYIFYQSIKEHVADVEQMTKAIKTREKRFDEDTNQEDKNDVSDSEEPEKFSKPKFTDHIKKIEKAFLDKYGELEQTVSSLPENNAVTLLMNKRSEWMSLRDHLGRSFLHNAVECNNSKFTKCLLISGANPNLAEGCGRRPLMLSILKENIGMVSLLVKCGQELAVHLRDRCPSSNLCPNKE